MRIREASSVTSVEKTIAKGAAKKPKTARSAEENKSRVTKPKARSPNKSTGAEPARGTRRGSNLGDLVELDMWDGTGKAKTAPKRKKISDAIVKAGKRVEVKQEKKEESPM